MRTILIVDDSATARRIIQQCLEMIGCAGYDFIQAADGLEALSKLREQEISLLITDMNMPNLDGVGLLKAVKSSPKLHHIPVFVISSLANPALENELRLIGVNKIIYKPASPQKLLDGIEQTLGKDFFE
ncbi:MAG: response regulator [Candidatus Riflebacteria bacterium]|nr:response regulator [Candidatus Riflebacteria bacterium]